MSYGIGSEIGVKLRAHVVAASRQPRILCATDLSERSTDAVRRAFLLAAELDAQLLLLHVVDERERLSIIGLRADRARSVLQAQAAPFASMNEPGAEITVRVGDPYRTITTVAKEWDADLVVLGAYRQRTGDPFLGTTAERVVRVATRAVLIVNGAAKTPYGGVLLASDLSAEFADVARLTRQLGLLDRARISLVHALRPASPTMLYAAGVREPNIERYLQSVRHSSLDTLRAQLQTAGLNPSRVRIIQENSTPSRAIERAVEATNPDLLVMGMSRHATLKRLLIGSVANDVLRKIDCDVLSASPAAVQRMARNDTLTWTARTPRNETEITA
jgi:universal stress protein E